MNERENRRKRVSEMRISEEPPKRLRVSDGSAQKTSVTQNAEATLPGNITLVDRQVASALLELKSQPRVNPEPLAGIVPVIQSLLVRNSFFSGIKNNINLIIERSQS
jgi:hypothetical protein